MSQFSKREGKKKESQMYILIIDIIKRVPFVWILNIDIIKKSLFYEKMTHLKKKMNEKKNDTFVYFKKKKKREKKGETFEPIISCGLGVSKFIIHLLISHLYLIFDFCPFHVLIRRTHL